MADVRALLRAERQKRQISHPHASYTADGKLYCNVCDVPIKSDAAWQSHLHSSNHTIRLGKRKDAPSLREADTPGKKRKASTLESPALEERKKPRPISPKQSLDDDASVVLTANDADEARAVARTLPDTEEAAQSGTETAGNNHATELAEFARGLADLEATLGSRSDISALPTISAAPMTAAEVAAQARKEQSAQRGKRDEELEAEKEDAAALLEDEFEQMESLEERVKRLRERREALRQSNTDSVEAFSRASVLDRDAPNGDSGDNSNVDNDDKDDNDDDDDADEDYDDWRFGAL